MNDQDSTETRFLLNAVAAGQLTAFERLFERHRDELHRAVTLRFDPRLQGRVDPSDVVQETHLGAFRRLEDFTTRRPMPFRLWLRRTAQERLIKLQERHLKASRRSVGRELTLPDQTSVLLANRLCSQGPTASQQALAQEAAKEVRAALDELAEIDREVLVMRYIERLSNQDIGCLLGLDPATVSKRHGRALIRLERVLRQVTATEESSNG